MGARERAGNTAECKWSEATVGSVEEQKGTTGSERRGKGSTGGGEEKGCVRGSGAWGGGGEGEERMR